MEYGRMRTFLYILDIIQMYYLELWYEKSLRAESEKVFQAPDPRIRPSDRQKTSRGLRWPDPRVTRFSRLMT